MSTGRNDPCPCGSGKKYKRCCLPADRAAPGAWAPRAAEFNPVEDDAVTPADVMSPQFWDDLEKRIPSTARKKLAPLARQARELAEYERRRPAIAAAQQTLEAYRRPYARLCRNHRKLLARAEALFAEAPFASMRFSADDLQRAFEAVGFPPMNRVDDAFFEVAWKAIDHLVAGEPRNLLARRLLLLLPEYVEQERYLDAWIIQHNALAVGAPEEGGRGVFLLCMFLEGLKSWKTRRDEEQRAMFRRLGVDPEELRRAGFDGAEPLIEGIKADKEKSAEIARFLEAHPELKAMSEAGCRESEDAALRLLQREDAESLLLSPDEVEPWVPVFAERLEERPGFSEAVASQSKPTAEQEKTVFHMLYEMGGEMAAMIFTEQRLRQLADAIRAYRRRLTREDGAGMVGANGALMAANAEDPPAENHFLAVLCATSLLDAVQRLGGEDGAEGQCEECDRP